MTLPTTPAESIPADDPARGLLDLQRERAERLLNGVRAAVLLLLGTAALAYAPALTPALNRVNVLVLAPTLAWTVAQYALYYRRPRLPYWLAIANPVVDITAVTAVIGGYALSHSAALALKTPIFYVYLAILGARPITSSTKRAAGIAGLAVAEYAALVAALYATRHVALTVSPVAASVGPSVSLLNEGFKLLTLALTGAIATYATAWHERMAQSYYRQSRDRELLETRLARAQLESLKLQLHPHFLFNTLNTITALVNTDPRGAERMISGLSELLRLSLHNAGEQEVPLEHELEVLSHYLDIQQIRFQDRLTVTLAVEPDARPALVPNLLLQPLVENAIRHGIAPRAQPGHIDVLARRQNGTLQLRVADDGVGLPTGRATVEGIGIGNTRARLRQLYGDRHRFALRPRTGGGLVVDVEIPFHTA